jgi:hypothetical protein
MIAVPKPIKISEQRPTRDEYELEELAQRLFDAYEEGEEIVLTVWGREEPVRGQIVKMDPHTKLVHVQRFGELVKVPFMDILKVERS